MAGPATSGHKIDMNNFSRRLQKFYDSWKPVPLDEAELKYFQEGNAADGPWKNVDAVAIVYGLAPSEAESIYKKSGALHGWLFGVEFTDTLIVFCPTSLYILTGPTKVKILEQVKGADVKKPVEVVTFVRDKKNPNSDAEAFQKIFEAVNANASDNCPKRVGVLRDRHSGDFATAWTQALAGSGLVQENVTPAVSLLLVQKDDAELKLIRTACTITTTVLKKHAVPDLEAVIDEGKSITHAAFAERIDKILGDATKISPKVEKFLLSPEVVESCYTPIIQSGGEYDLQPDAASNDAELHFGTILVSMGARYKLYCSNVARTYFVDPKKDQETNYNHLLEVQKKVLKAMKPGTKISELYKTAIDYIDANCPELRPHFTPNLGAGIGIEFREASLLINEKNERELRSNMVFNLTIGFNNLERKDDPKDPKQKKYALLLADTVLVREDGGEILTIAPSKFQDVSYFLEDTPVEEPVKLEKKEVIEESVPSDAARARKEREAAERQKELEAQLRRKQHQQELAKKKREEAERRLKARMDKEGKDVGVVAGDIVAYSKPDELPKDITMHKIYVDTRRDTVLLPVYGVMVPFHISTIKNVSKNEDDLRINFIAPGAPMAFGQKLLGMKDNVVYIRELTFHCPDTKGLNNSLRLIKELRKRFTQQKAHEQDVRTLQAQEKLILSKTGKNARLTDVYIRPNIAGRRTVGTVEVHQNGLRFSSVKGGQIDILFGNIKHAFFQPAEHEMIVLIHFHLKTDIMVGKRKTKDVQFYVEVMEMSHALDGTKKGGFDADEIEDEERERELRNKLNDEFQKFVRKVEEASGLDFDIPYRDLGFYGVPHRSAVFLQPTVNCLVHLTEAPFVVITLDDIEVAHFERVQFSLRNFDLVFVFKDFSLMHINSIPMESLDTIKEWLDSCNIKYYEGPHNLNWSRIIAHIKEDPAKFYEEGGFEFLNTESSSDEGEGDDESEDESGDFKPPESDSDDSDSDEDDSDAYSAVSEDESESGSGDEEDENAPTWEELEERAREEDRQRGPIDERVGKRKRDEYSDDEEEQKAIKAHLAPTKKPVPSASKPSSAGVVPKKPAVSSLSSKPAAKPGASKPAPKPLTSAKPPPRPPSSSTTATAAKPAPKPVLKK